MLSRLAYCSASSSGALRLAAARTSTTTTVVVAPITFAGAVRCLSSTVRDAATIDDALKFSGYSSIDFTIPEDAPTYDAVQKFAAFNIGCLVTTDKAGACFLYCRPIYYLYCYSFVWFFLSFHVSVRIIGC